MDLAKAAEALYDVLIDETRRKVRDIQRPAALVVLVDMLGLGILDRNPRLSEVHGVDVELRIATNALQRRLAISNPRRTRREDVLQTYAVDVASRVKDVELHLDG